jgi:hypothetical protein
MKKTSVLGASALVVFPLSDHHGWRRITVEPGG